MVSFIAGVGMMVGMGLSYWLLTRLQAEDDAREAAVELAQAARAEEDHMVRIMRYTVDLRLRRHDEKCRQRWL